MTFRVLDKSGDTVKEFNMTAKKEAQLAAKQFNEYLNQGKQMIGIMPDGTKFMSAQFEPEATVYVVGKRLVGG